MPGVAVCRKSMESKTVFEVNDVANGLLTGKGAYNYENINGLIKHVGYTMLVMNVAVKDGKFRYQLDDIASPGVRKL